MATAQKTESPQLPLDAAPIMVRLDKILPNPYQPESRLNFPETMIKRMAASIKEHGLILIPVARVCRDVKADYQMGDGWLRLAAYRFLVAADGKQYESIPLIIRELTDRQMADMVIEANTVRQDMTPLDLATFYKRYLTEFKITQTELGKLEQRSQGEIANTIRLLELPEDIQQKVISREISETHARTLLQLGAHINDKKVVGNLITRIVQNHASVAEIDNRVKEALWNKTLALSDESSYGSAAPLFDTAACEKCERRQMLKKAWSAKEEKVPRCADQKCWKDKQEVALTAQNEAIMKQHAKQGVTRLLEYDYKTMVPLNSEHFSECGTCAKRAASKNNYSIGTFTVCTDKSCHDSKSRAKREADRKAQQAEEEKAEQYKEKVFTNLNPDSPAVLQAIIECLLEAVDEDEGAVEFIKSFSLFEVKLDDDGYPEDNIDNARIMAAVHERADQPTLLRMIARCAFETAHLSRQEEKRLLDAFKAGSQGVKAPQKDAKALVPPPGKPADPLATFVLHVATESKAKHRIEFKGSEYENANLVHCIQLAFGARPLDKVKAEIESYPASANRKVILSILEGTSTDAGGGKQL